MNASVLLGFVSFISDSTETSGCRLQPSKRLMMHLDSHTMTESL